MAISGLPHHYNSEDYLRMLAVGNQLSVKPPRQLTANGRAFPRKTGGVIKRIIQNVGINPIFFWVQEEAPIDYSGDPLTSPPHGVITPDTGDKKGYGGQVDFANYTNEIWVGNATGILSCLLLEAHIDEPHAQTDELV